MPSHPPGVYGVHPLGPDPIPARLARHRDVVVWVAQIRVRRVRLKRVALRKALWSHDFRSYDL
ncbi:hypothetical protein T12_13483 [Trichinella patagoniensis]|uniref:Uncharacterized protein n=1 Tax=Trichinella patagoniensis TaxID=990121 RepID=A0A0V0Z3E7_9BILA|nr:hypothetical protein T12_13483 [Trichinella patagoniensis]